MFTALNLLLSRVDFSRSLIFDLVKSKTKKSQFLIQLNLRFSYYDFRAKKISLTCAALVNAGTCKLNELTCRRVAQNDVCGVCRRLCVRS